MYFLEYIYKEVFLFHLKKVKMENEATGVSFSKGNSNQTEGKSLLVTLVLYW